MRKVIWIPTGKPESMNDEEWLRAATLLANAVNGELVKFGTNSYIIIGDEKAEKAFKQIQEMKQEVV
jgi:hypothetical protein